MKVVNIIFLIIISIALTSCNLPFSSLFKVSDNKIDKAYDSGQFSSNGVDLTISASSSECSYDKNTCYMVGTKDGVSYLFEFNPITKTSTELATLNKNLAENFQIEFLKIVNNKIFLLNTKRDTLISVFDQKVNEVTSKYNDFSTFTIKNLTPAGNVLFFTVTADNIDYLYFTEGTTIQNIEPTAFSDFQSGVFENISNMIYLNDNNALYFTSTIDGQILMWRYKEGMLTKLINNFEYNIYEYEYIKLVQDTIFIGVMIDNLHYLAIVNNGYVNLTNFNSNFNNLPIFIKGLYSVKDTLYISVIDIINNKNELWKYNSSGFSKITLLENATWDIKQIIEYRDALLIYSLNTNDNTEHIFSIYENAVYKLNVSSEIIKDLDFEKTASMNNEFFFFNKSKNKIYNLNNSNCNVVNQIQTANTKQFIKLYDLQSSIVYETKEDNINKTELNYITK